MMRKRVIRVVYATAIECTALFLWLTYADDHTIAAIVILIVGEILESGPLFLLTLRSPRMPAAERDAQTVRAHLRRVRKMTSAAIPAEIVIWLLWLTLADHLDEYVAAGVLLVLMHLKHQLEFAALSDTSFTTRFFQRRLIVGSLSEVAGAVACLALLHDDHPWIAGAALVVGITLEHSLLIDALETEQERRDIRLPRHLELGGPARRSSFLRREGLRTGLPLWCGSHLAPLWWVASRIPPLRLAVNSFIINQFGYAMKTRPNALSTMEEYTTWPSLTDRTFNARHLPPTAPRGLPAPGNVQDLFERGPGGARLSDKSTLLFAHFAQWFVDGFLRIDPQNPQKNTSTHDIDLSQLYGQCPEVTTMLREGKGGRLKCETIAELAYPPYYFDEDGNVKEEFANLVLHYPHDLEAGRRRTLFALGFPRGNIYYGFTMMSTLFLREHNRLAALIEAENKGDHAWDDDRIFETTRNTLIVILLKIVIQDYVNHITPFKFKLSFEPGTGASETWFRQNWMSIEFNLLYRWHALVPTRIRVHGQGQPTSDVQWNNDIVTEGGIGTLFSEASRQPCGEIGLFNTAPFLLPLERRAIKIGRETQVAGYNDYRQACGYPRMRSFADVSSRPEVQAALRGCYDTVDDIELYVGLFAEDVFPKGALPALMGTMVGADAFSQVLTNPLLTTNLFSAKTFSGAGMKAIDDTETLADIVQRNLGDEDGSDLLVTFTQERSSRRGRRAVAQPHAGAQPPARQPAAAAQPPALEKAPAREQPPAAQLPGAPHQPAGGNPAPGLVIEARIEGRYARNGRRRRRDR